MRFTDLSDLTAALSRELEGLYLSSAVVTKAVDVGGGGFREGSICSMEECQHNFVGLLLNFELTSPREVHFTCVVMHSNSRYC